MKLLTTAQAHEWRSYIDKLPNHLKDVHFLPEMMLPYEVAGLGTGILVVEEDTTGFVLQPLLKMADGSTRHPFNFGGPVRDGTIKPTLVDQICTLNPFLNDHQRMIFQGRVEHVKDTVWVDLTQPIKLRDKTKHTLGHAPEAGAVTSVVNDQSSVSLFASMYDETMRRVDADPHWLFPYRWFNQLINGMPNNITMLQVSVGNTKCATCILLHGFDTCYYHFAASWSTSQRGVNHLMVLRAIEWARDNGFKRFHLGGGVRPGEGDGLFKFKSGFSKLRLPVYRYDSRNTEGF